jgi:hypothetical protein
MEYRVLAAYFDWSQRGVRLQEREPGKLTASGPLRPGDVDDLRRHKWHYIALLSAEQQQ